MSHIPGYVILSKLSPGAFSDPKDFNTLDWLAQPVAHIPSRHEQTIIADLGKAFAFLIPSPQRVQNCFRIFARTLIIEKYYRLLKIH
jgi:hypothetical protein